MMHSDDDREGEIIASNQTLQTKDAIFYYFVIVSKISGELKQIKIHPC